MGLPVVLLLEPDPARRDELTEAFRRAFVDVLAVTGPRSAERAGVVSPQAVVVSVLADRDGPESLLAFMESPGRPRLPLLAVVPPGDDRLAEAAVRAGAVDVLRWPAPDALVRARLRSVVRSGLLQEEAAGFPRVLEEVVRAFEAREAHTIEHSARVARLSVEVGRSAGLSAEELERLRQASLIHDLGMIAVPPDVAGRAHPLPPEEEAIVRSHPLVGAEMLRGVPALEPLRPFLLMHHERIDGSGYPEGVPGPEIPLPVRILSLTEAYDALTSNRPWRPVRSHADAMAVLRDEVRRGRWDRDLVEALDAAVARLMGPAAPVVPA